MDIANLNAKESSFMPLRHPATGQVLKDDAGNQVGFTLGGTYSEAWRNKLNRMANSKMNKRQKATAEQNFEELGELFAAVTFDVHNLELSGEKITPKNVVDVYNNGEYGWIRKQVDEHIGDDANFFDTAGTA